MRGHGLVTGHSAQIPATPLRCILAALGAVAALAGPARAGELAGFYAESTSVLVSRRIGTMTRKHKTWLTAERLRFDHEEATFPDILARHFGAKSKPAHGCDALTTIVDLRSGEILIANRAQHTYIRQSLKNLGGALAELGDAMRKHVASRIARTYNVETIAGRPCRLCRVELARTPCEIWVEEDSREVFLALRAMARTASGGMGDRRAPLVMAFGGLGGVPRKIVIGDPERLALTWTVERTSTEPIAPSTFELPVAFRENPKVAAMSYTLLEHIYLVGEAAAARFAPSPDKRNRSLMPRGMAITTESVLKDFYEGRRGAERYGIFRWSRPMTFFLAPELWRYPMSGRAIDFLIVIGTSFRGGGLRYYPALEMIELPAN